MCLVQKPEGMIRMTRLGFACYVARDITDAMGGCGSSEGADRNTAYAVAYIEKHIGPSFDLEETFRKAGHWKDDGEIVNHVMIRPWAPQDRPKLFNDSLAVGLKYYGMPGVEVGPDTGFQYREPPEEGAFMRPEDYEVLVEAPTDYLFNVWLPRLSRDVWWQRVSL